MCHLKKAIYGLKQASHAWNQQFHGVLTELSFMWTFANAGIYVYHQHGRDGPLIIILYIDNITIMGTSLKAIKQLKADLAKRYELTDLGEILSYLGIHITYDHSRKCLYIDQSEYIKDVLDRFGMNREWHG